eukprot:3422551-Pyramimonas_sp.AAC.1
MHVQRGRDILNGSISREAIVPIGISREERYGPMGTIASHDMDLLRIFLPLCICMQSSSLRRMS